LSGGKREGAKWVVRERLGAGGEMNQALYAHINNKRKRKKKVKKVNQMKLQNTKIQ
jgi:hypothetical protein